MIKFREWLEQNLTESGDSASHVRWRKEHTAKIGEFNVKSRKTGEISTYTIVINKLDHFKKTKLTNLEMIEFKFFDPEGDIVLTNNMEFVSGVAPTIKREFEALMRTDPEAVVFTADKHEPSRVKHYEKFTHKIANEFGYIPFFKTAITSTDDAFALIREDKVPELKTYSQQ